MSLQVRQEQGIGEQLQVADINAIDEKEAARQDIKARANAAGRQLTILTTHFGEYRDIRRREQGFEGLSSGLISLGTVPAADGKDIFGFARINAIFDVNKMLKPVKAPIGLRFLRMTAYDTIGYVRGSNLQSLALDFFTGDEDGTGLEHHSTSVWDKVEHADDSEALATVEQHLASILEGLNDPFGPRVHE